MRFLSLYSGIGLHDLGFNRAGIEIVGQVELDPYCRAVLEMHWPNLPRWSDVRDVTVDAVRERCGRIDGITGGFMCTDISVAGAGKGIGRETRSGLTWREMFRLIRGLCPGWLVLENVPALRNRGADRVLPALERIGYACWPLVVGAEHVGAPHRRHRVWIIGRLDDAKLARWIEGRGIARDEEGSRRGRGESVVADRLADPFIHARLGGLSQPQREAEGGIAADGAGDCLSVADAARGGQRTDRSACGDAGHADERRENLADAADGGLQSYAAAASQEDGSADSERNTGELSRGPCGSRWPARPGEPQHEWEAPRLVESGVGGAASGSSRRLAGFARRSALKALGNANPPQCAEVIGRAVLAFAKEAA